MGSLRTRFRDNIRRIALGIELWYGHWVEIQVYDGYRELSRDINGRETLLHRAPISGRPTGFFLGIPLAETSSSHRCLAYVHDRLSSFAMNPTLCSYLAPKIAAALSASTGLRRSFIIKADVEVLHEWIFEETRRMDIMGLTDPTSAMVDGVLVFNSEQGAGHARSQVQDASLDVSGMVMYGHDCVGKDVDPCSICLEGFCSAERIIKIPCTHLFHETCIRRWLEYKNTCPLCRSQVKRQPSFSPSCYILD